MMSRSREELAQSEDGNEAAPLQEIGMIAFLSDRQGVVVTLVLRPGPPVRRRMIRPAGSRPRDHFVVQGSFRAHL